MRGVRLGYVIIYVAGVAETVDFYERAFGLQRRFLHDSGAYAEMETGGTALAFADESAAPAGVELGRNRLDKPCAGAEIALVVDDVEVAYRRALEAGAIATGAPETKPWGQVVSYVRDTNGVLVELCSEISR